MPVQGCTLPYLSACTRVHFTLPQCLYKGALYLTSLPVQGCTLPYLSACTREHFTLPQCLYKGALFTKTNRPFLGLQPVSNSMGVRGFIPPGLKKQGVKLSTYFHLLPSSRMGVAVTLLPLYAFMAWTKKCSPLRLSVRLVDLTMTESDKALTATSSVSSQSTWHVRDRLFCYHHRNI